MPSAFSQTMRSLQADGFRPSRWGLIVVGMLVAAGSGWLFWAQIAVYETTRQARMEVGGAVHPVAAPMAGRVAAAHLELGRLVQTGDLLVELESESARLLLEEEKSRLTTFTRRREALAEQIAAEEAAWPDERTTAQLTTDESRARQREANARAQFADAETERMKELGTGGLVSKSESQRVEAEAGQQRASASALALTVAKLESVEKSRGRNQETRRARWRRDTALLEGEIATAAATIKRCEFDLEQRRIRAPVAGRLGEIGEDLHIGGFVSAGQRIGAIIPQGELKAVAHFSPFTSLGRIRPGQPARLRLDGFPWAQYGSVCATVASAANEPRDGSIRVELAVQMDAASLIPFQHGLSSTVEVEVERVSPVRLLLRAAGALLAVPSHSPATRDGTE
jgi:membrane fusion protein (multidrug efflux system)